LQYKHRPRSGYEQVVAQHPGVEFDTVTQKSRAPHCNIPQRANGNTCGDRPR
jgi:hypothetical protein